MAKHTQYQLTDLLLRKGIKEPKRYTDGPGSNGLSALAKWNRRGQLVITFHQRIRINRKVTMLSLGPYPQLTLKEARKKAAANVRAVRERRDPRIRGKNTFEEITIKYIEYLKKCRKWPDGNTSYRVWLNSLRTYVFPHIGLLAPDQIDSVHIMRLLLPIWITKNETAKRIGRRISRVMLYARAWGLCDSDPAKVALDGLPPVNIPTKHRKALHHSLLGEAIRIVAASDANQVAINALIFITLTCVRSSEALKATWDQIDLENRVWRIPASNVKNNRGHDVPLSEAVIRLLEHTAQLTGTRTGLVFPAPRGGTMSTDAPLQLLRNCNIPADVHGARSSFRSWTTDQGIDEKTAEFVLAHNKRDPYDRSTLFEKRIAIMDKWANYLNI